MPDDCEGWNIKTLKAFYDQKDAQVQSHIEQLIRENQRQSDERWENLKEQLSLERDTINSRFEAANRYKETYSQRIGDLENITLKRIEFDTRLDNVQEKLEVLSKTNWGAWLGFATVFLGIIGGVWLVIGLKIDTTNQPLAIELSQLTAADQARDRSIADLRQEFKANQTAADVQDGQIIRDISNLKQNTESSRIDRAQINERLRLVEGKVSGSEIADANSRTDRGQLNERIHQLESTVATNAGKQQANDASFKAALVEIETQFCAADTVRNLMHANDLRVQSVLWAHTPSLGHYPTDNAFYPSVCNRQPDKK